MFVNSCDGGMFCNISNGWTSIVEPCLGIDERKSSKSFFLDHSKLDRKPLFFSLGPCFIQFLHECFVIIRYHVVNRFNWECLKASSQFLQFYERNTQPFIFWVSWPMTKPWPLLLLYSLQEAALCHPVSYEPVSLTCSVSFSNFAVHSL